VRFRESALLAAAPQPRPAPKAAAGPSDFAREGLCNFGDLKFINNINYSDRSRLVWCDFACRHCEVLQVQSRATGEPIKTRALHQRARQFNHIISGLFGTYSFNVDDAAADCWSAQLTRLLRRDFGRPFQPLFAISPARFPPNTPIRGPFLPDARTDGQTHGRTHIFL